jgi:hypothetical protein
MAEEDDLEKTMAALEYAAASGECDLLTRHKK